MTELRRGNLRVEWEDIGEGMSGDYNPDDPDDIPLLRFTVLEFHKTNEFGGQWREREDSSYCTLMPVGTPDELLHRASEMILDAAESTSSKRAMEELSWISPKWFEKDEVTVDPPGTEIPMATDEEIERSFDAYR